MILLLLAACGGTTFPLIREDVAPDSGFDCSMMESPLSAEDVKALTPDGCGYTVVAAAEDGTYRLLLDVPVFADVLVNGAGSATYTLPDDAVVLEVETGCNVNAAWCTDDVDGSPVVDLTYVATAGTVTVSAEASEDTGSRDATATITLEAIELENEGGETLTIDALTWEGVRLYIAELG